MMPIWLAYRDSSQLRSWTNTNTNKRLTFDEEDGLLTEIEAHEEVSHGEVANQKPERWYGWQNHVDFDGGGDDDDFDNYVDDGGDYGGDDEDDDRPWDIDPIPAAREDEDHAAVAEQGEQEDDPDSTTESPPEDEHVGDDHDLVDDNEE